VARWRSLSATETTVAETLIEDAELLLDQERPELAALVTAGDVPLRTVTMVVCEMVQRVLRNPDVLRGQNLGADGGIGATFAQGVESQTKPRLRLLDDDLKIIDQAIAAAAETPTSPVQSRRMRAWPYYTEPDPAPLPTP
jgi:hypothetical protein